MTTNAESNSTARPVAPGERIAALDVLRGFALLGIFIMNMPGFTHSLFATPAPEANGIDAVVAVLRELFFAGKFNLLFGLLFGIGFALQTKRLREGAEPGRAGLLYARRLSFLLAIGLVHAMLLWAGDVLVVYAVLGFALLALRRTSDRALFALIAVCLVLPALAELARTLFFSLSTETVAAFQYQQLEASNDLAFGHGSFFDAMLETARIFFWTYSSAFGLFAYSAFYVQMATGILAGFVIGRRGWAGAHRPAETTLAAAQKSALAVAIVGIALAAVGAGAASDVPGSSAIVFFAALAKTISRAALAAFYALVVLRLMDGRDIPRWLRALAAAGRMPLSNYLLQTLLGSFIFYGWGLGFWGRAGPTTETMLAIALFAGVQLPLSAWWLARFRYGPLETLWRRVTYGAAVR